MANSDDSSSSSSDDGGEYVFNYQGRDVTETELITWLHSSDQKYKKLLYNFIQYSMQHEGEEVFEVLFKNGYRLGVMNGTKQTIVHLTFYEECYRIEGRHRRRGHLKSTDDFRYNPSNVIDLLMTEWMCKWSDSLDHTDIYGLNYLHIACFMGDMKMVKKCFTNNKVNSIFSRPESVYSLFTPLHFAVINETSDAVRIVKYLLKKGANVYAKDLNGRTPLHLSCRLFIDPQNFIEENLEKRNDGKITFDLLSNCSSKNIEILKVLLDNHCDLEIKDNDGNTPLLSIFPENYYGLLRVKDYCHFDEIVPIQETVTKFSCLVEAGSNVSVKNYNYDTILHHILKNLEIWRNSAMDESSSRTECNFNDYYHSMLVQRILNIKEDFNINIINQNAETPLQLAVTYLSEEIVKILLDYNVEISSLRISWANRRLFDFDDVAPNLFMVRNIIAITDLFHAKDYELTPAAHLAILRFLTHEHGNCECHHDIYNLLHFGSPSHVVNILKEVYDDNGKIDFSYYVAEFYLQDIEFGGLYIDHTLRVLLKKLMEEEDINKRYNNDDLQQKLNIMKLMKLQDNTSLFDIMIKHPYNIPQFVINSFDTDRLYELSHQYDDIVRGHLTKSLVRPYVLKYGISSVKYLLPFLPDLCCEEIIQYLSNADIMNIYSISVETEANEVRFFL